MPADSHMRIRGLLRRTNHGLMWGHQSQAHSTHPIPFGISVKNALRLNRDQSFLSAEKAVYRITQGMNGVSVTVS